MRVHTILLYTSGGIFFFWIRPFEPIDLFRIGYGFLSVYEPTDLYDIRFPRKI